MADLLKDISAMVKDFGSAPTMAEMPRRSLQDKGIAGPTSAHTIEEIHAPLNLAYVTFTTGTSAFQNIVGVTYEELPERIKASTEVLRRVGLKAGDKVVVTYPPLVNVFSGQAMKEYGLHWKFLVRSSRDAFLAALYEEKPAAVIGESSFLRAALEDAAHLGVSDELPKDIILLAAGTPLDLELLPVAKQILNATVHDLYGCQEFGWITLDGIPLREDLELVPVSKESGPEMREIVVGGIPTGDSFAVSGSGHVCNRQGKIITYRRQRTYPEFEVVVKETSLTSKVTIDRAARSILRIKGRVVKVSPYVKTGQERTKLELIPDRIQAPDRPSIEICGPEKTKLFDDLVKAQLDYQQNGKADPLWSKRS